MYESCSYDNAHGEPVVVLVTTGAHDVTWLIDLLTGESAHSAHAALGAAIADQVAARQAEGCATRPVAPGTPGTPRTSPTRSPSDPAGLGAWLRAFPDATIVQAADGGAWQLDYGIETGDGAAREFRALLPALGPDPFEITEGHPALEILAALAPFTVLPGTRSRRAAAPLAGPRKR